MQWNQHKKEEESLISLHFFKNVQIFEFCYTHKKTISYIIVVVDYEVLLIKCVLLCDTLSIWGMVE